MAMTPPTPHLVSSTRVVHTDGETFVTPTAVLSSEAALVVPWQPDTMPDGTFLGPGDTSKYVMFIGFDADVKLGDEITNDTTGDVFIVFEPPQHWQNPRSWENDHQQVILRISPLG